MRGPRNSIRAMTPAYDQILDIMHRAMAEVTAAGYDLRCCVWELSPSILGTIENHLRHEYPETRAYTGGPNSFHGIPIRQGVTDEATGILLKQVNLSPRE
jgi:hypothetical protein